MTINQYTITGREHIKKIINKVGGILLENISDEIIEERLNEIFNNIEDNEKKIIIGSLIVIETKLNNNSNIESLLQIIQDILKNQFKIYKLILPSTINEEEMEKNNNNNIGEETKLQNNDEQ